MKKPPTSEEVLAAVVTLYGIADLGDYVYDIRDRVLSDTSHTGSTWNHPKVQQWSNACGLLQRAVNAAKEKA